MTTTTLQKHTPGPWRFMTDSTGDYLAVFATPQGGTKVICPVKITDEADARLIAAAPELLKALKAAVELIYAWHGEVAGDIYLKHAPEIGRIHAAIAKADGTL